MSEDTGGIEELSQKDGRKLFDEVCRRELGMSGKKFLRKWDRGDYEGVDVDDEGNDGLFTVILMIPFGR